ncbi:MAG: helix-turn-helix domain-containing protein [Roseovarius sp.]
MYVTLPCEFHAAAPNDMSVDVAACSNETRLKSKSYLYYEGDTVDWLYQVKSGVLRLTRVLEDGRRQVIAFGFPGDIVGFPSNGLHHTDCDALVDARLQPYRRSSLDNCKADPKLHRLLLDAALHEISAMQDHFMMLGRKSAAEKVASFLCVLANRIGTDAGGCQVVELPMSRSDIADFLGLTTETVCRVFTQLRKSKIIEINNIYTIKVLRADALLGLTIGHQD